jgi:DNA-binding transcriptional LysR family regulator
MDWDKLRVFFAVAEAGSLTHAGEVLHLSQSAVSRQITALEESLDTILFHRHARGLILTEQGELLLDTTAVISKEIKAASARIRDSEDEVFGELKVTTTTAFGTLWLAPRLSRLYEIYPNLKIDLMLEERVLDLPMRQADVAIRMKEPSQADLVRRRLMSVTMRLFGSNDYLQKNGTPQNLNELAHHRIISQNMDTPQTNAGLELTRKLFASEHESHLTVNNYFGVLQSVIHNLGIGVLPDYVEDDFSNIQRVLPEIKSSEVPVYLAYPEELRHSKRVTAFRDFVVDEVVAFRKSQKK